MKKISMEYRPPEQPKDKKYYPIQGYIYFKERFAVQKSEFTEVTLDNFLIFIEEYKDKSHPKEIAKEYVTENEQWIMPSLIKLCEEKKEINSIYNRKKHG